MTEYRVTIDLRDGKQFLTFLESAEKASETMNHIFDCMAANLPVRVRNSAGTQDTIMNPESIIRAFVDEVKR